MPYLKFLDENKRDAGIPPIDMAGIEFRIAPARVPGVLYTFVNASTVVSLPLVSANSITAVVYLGTYEDVDDTKPLTVIRLVSPGYLKSGDRMAISPGSLTLDMTSVYQACD